MRHPIVFSAALCAASVLVGTPALAQMKTGAPSTPVAAPAASTTVTAPASGSVAAMDASGSLNAGASSSLAVVKPTVAKEAPSGGFSLPSLPKIPFVDITAGAEFGTGPANASFVSFEKVTKTVAMTSPLPNLVTPEPALGNASSTGSGMAFLVDVGLPLSLGVGLKQQTLGLTSTSPTFSSLKGLSGSTYDAPPAGTTYDKPTTTVALLPSSYTDLYARFLMFKGGLRMESYPGTPGANSPAGNYTNAMGGLNLGLSLFDLVSVNACGMTGIGLSKPAGLGDSVMHMPLDFDAYASLKLFMVRARVGYHIVGAANADPSRIGDLFGAMTAGTDPTKLAEISSNIAKASSAMDAIATNRLGLFSMPYLALEIAF